MREAPHGNNKNVHLLDIVQIVHGTSLTIRGGNTDTSSEIKHGNVLCLLNVKTFVTNGNL